jgi:hypothetical protein
MQSPISNEAVAPDSSVNWDTVASVKVKGAYPRSPTSWGSGLDDSR